VTQFLVEEACFELALMQEHRGGTVSLDEPEVPSPAEIHEATMAKLKAGN
jgi:hypothetical protein